jgi:hypothetical protein
LLGTRIIESGEFNGTTSKLEEGSSREKRGVEVGRTRGETSQLVRTLPAIERLLFFLAGGWKFFSLTALLIREEFKETSSLKR